MNATDYKYATIKSHPLTGRDDDIDPEAREGMQDLAVKYPGCRIAAAQCVDLSSRNIGHLKFVAVGPNNSIPCVTDPKLTHWSYYFVGFVNLDTFRIEPFTPEAT